MRTKSDYLAFRLLEPRLKADGFNVLNKGVAIYFPSTGGQTKFHEQFAAALKSIG